MASAKQNTGPARVVFPDARPEKAMFFNAFFVETEQAHKVIHFALRNRAQVVLDDFVCSMADQDVQAIKAGLEKFAGTLGAPTGNVDDYRLPRPPPEKRTIRNVRVMHAANASEIGEITFYEFSLWQASTKSRGASTEAVQATCTAVLTCPLDVMKALFLEVF